MLQTQLQQILDATNWESRYRFLMKLGSAANLPFDETDKIELNLVSGCESSVWLTTKQLNNELLIQATSDSKIVRGLLVIILHELSNTNITGFNLNSCLSKYHLANHLSESRANGLKQVHLQIIQKIRQAG